jgi:dihydrofolate reductase
MSKVRVSSYGVSIDGFGAGLDQDLDHPLGVGGERMHEWFFKTRTYAQMHGSDDAGATGVDDAMAARGFDNVGAWIMGRNMFGPVRGPWLNEDWKGWWGENPPFHTEVFVLTHHARAPLSMNGGTTFYFVTDGIHAALERARAAANGKDVRLGGGVATIRQFLKAGLIDSMHLAMAPVLLGRGEPLLAGIDMTALRFTCTERTNGEGASHVVLTRS